MAEPASLPVEPERTPNDSVLDGAAIGAAPASGPIFIVGLPRSGTTLLATMLASHPRIDCGPETYFFRWLPADVRHLVDRARWPGPATDHVCALPPDGAHKVHVKFGLTREDVERALNSRTASVAAMLESLTVTHARAAGKPRWAEKTPGHFANLRRIRETYPDAAILWLVRDPRDTALSISRVPWTSDSLLEVLYRMSARERRWPATAARDPRLLTVRFETLVTAPEQELRRICAFIGEAFHPDMIASKERAVAADHEWWKLKAAEPPDPSRIGVWRREMSEAQQRAASFIAAEALERHGYEGAANARVIVAIEPDGLQFARRHEDVAWSLAEHGVLIADGHSGRSQRCSQIVFWPRAEHDPWALGHWPRTRPRRLARMAALLARQLLAGRPAIRIREPGAGHRDRAAEVVLRLMARPMSAAAWLASLGIEAGSPTARAAWPKGDAQEHGAEIVTGGQVR
jgi:hypothetical protein